MYTSTYAEEIDFKSGDFSKSCCYILKKKKEGLSPEIIG